MHKGYAFVQFTSPFDARSACLGEDGRSISGQVIDVNMVSEPKPSHGQQKTSASPANNKGAGQKRTHGDAATGDSGEDGTQVQIFYFSCYCIDSSNLFIYINIYAKYSIQDYLSTVISVAGLTT